MLLIIAIGLGVHVADNALRCSCPTRFGEYHSPLSADTRHAWAKMIDRTLGRAVDTLLQRPKLTPGIKPEN